MPGNILIVDYDRVKRISHFMRNCCIYHCLVLPLYCQVIIQDFLTEVNNLNHYLVISFLHYWIRTVLLHFELVKVVGSYLEEVELDVIKVSWHVHWTFILMIRINLLVILRELVNNTLKLFKWFASAKLWIECKN